SIFYVKDLENRYVYGSPYGFRLFGVEWRDAIGKSDTELFPSHLAQRFIARDRKVLDQKTIEEISFDVPVPGAGARHLAGVRFVINHPDGAPMGVCGFAIDVTERIELAQRLEKLA